MKSNVFLFIFLFLLTSCSDTKDKGLSDSEMMLSVSELFFNADEESQSVVLTCSDNWEASSDAVWCDISPNRGSGKQEVIITVEENRGNEERDCIVTFSSGQQTVRLTVKQYQVIDSDYIDLNLDEEGVQVAFNQASGEVSIEYPKKPIHAVQPGQAFVLTEDYNYDIRIVQQSQVDGNTVRLQTKQGNMSDLFKNINFTLTSDPQRVPLSSRSRGHRIYTPAKVIGHTQTGKVVLYDRTSLTREREIGDNNLEISEPIFVIEQDFANYEFFNNEAGRLYWKKCNYGIRMDGVFTFDFGETQKDGRIVGLPQKFSTELVGSYGSDFLLKYELIKSYQHNEETISDERILYKTFIFYPNGVPVPITIDAHLGKRSEFSASAEVEMQAGFSMSGEARLGVAFEQGQISPIYSFEPKFEVVPPEITVNGTLEGKMSYFPSVDIRLFNFIGPVIEPAPYLKEKFVVEGNLGEEWAESYSLLSGGMDIRLGLKMDFLMFGEQEWKSDMINLIKQPLIVMPARLVPLSPANGTPTDLVSTHQVQLRVDGYNYLKGGFFPCPFAWVNTFTDGELNTTIASDANGLVNTSGITDKSGYSIRGSDLKFTHVEDNQGTLYVDWDGNTNLDFSHEW